MGAFGIAVGRWTWSAFANQFGILPESAMSVATILLAIPSTILFANLLAAVPGRIAARMHPAQVLRAE
jgi:ABC-type antimicrobial peptide transport system permease subunit